MSVYLLTPTGGRPEGLALLGEYINAQTYSGRLHWIIVDDCVPVSRVPWMRDGVDATTVRPGWVWKPGMNTQAASIRAGLELVPDDARLLMLEDDDAYLPAYIETMLQALRKCDLVGERVARYYNVATGRCRSLPSSRHSSLAATGLRGAALNAFRGVLRAAQTGLDVRLWQRFTGPKQLLDTANVIGIKGMPGRAGVGVGHRANFGTPDNDGTLEKWLGEYAENYRIFRRAA